MAKNLFYSQMLSRYLFQTISHKIYFMFQTDNFAIPMPDVLPDSIPNGGKALAELKTLSFDDAISKVANSLVSFGFKLMIAILVFYVGRFIIRKIYHTVYSVMSSRKVDPSLTTFVLSLV